MERVRIVLCCAALVTLVSGCPPPGGPDTQPPDPPPPPPAPAITSRPAPADPDLPPNPVNPFGGFIYPPAPDDARNRLEIDAPLRSLVLGADDRAHHGPPYYAFTINFQVVGLRFLELEWRADNGAVFEMEQLDGPCDPVSGLAARELMEETALRETGVRSVAAYDLPVNEKLAAGDPVWWVTCEPDNDGELIAEEASPVTVDYNVAVLLPRTVLGADQEGELRVRSRGLFGGPDSETLSIPIRRSPDLLAVAGDSVAWGQGLTTQGKYWRMLHQWLSDELQRPTRMSVQAHSGAHLRSGDTPSIGRARQAAACRAPERDVDPEIPFRPPSVQCQILRLVDPFCYVDASQLGEPGVVPRLSCSSEDSGAPGGEWGVPASVEFPFGPRYDFVFLDGCINDVGSVWLHTEIDGPLPEVVERTEEECDLRNSLPDLRAELPNAALTYTGYHLTWSHQSMPLSPLTCPSAAGAAITTPPGFPFNMFLFTNAAAASEEVADRVELFMHGSDEMLADSIAELAQPAPGRGSLRFVPLDFFTQADAAYAGSTLNFELDCINPIPVLGPMDPVRTTRTEACTALFTSVTLADIVSSFDWITTNWSADAATKASMEFCRRASFLHPNEEANELMFERVKKELEEDGLP